MQIFSKQLRDTLHPASLLFIQKIFELSPTQPTSEEIRAIDFLATSLISSNLWPKFRAIYPMVGRSRQSTGINLKNPYRHNIVWYNSLIFNKNGVTNVGTGYGNTFVAPAWFTDDNIHVSAYNATAWNSTSAECVLIGSTTDDSLSTWMHTISLRRRPQTFVNNDPAQGISTGAIFTYSCGSYPPHRSAGFDAGDQLNSQAWGLIVGVDGIYCYTGGQRLGATSSITDPVSSQINPLVRNSFNIGIQTVSQYPFLLLAHRPFGSVAKPRPANSNNIEQTSKANIRFASIGNSLSDQENQTFYNIVEEFQTILNRNVGTFRLGEGDVFVDETNPRVSPQLKINSVRVLTTKRLYQIKDELENKFTKENEAVGPALSINKIEVFGPRRVYTSDASAASVNILNFTEI
jgi:hypothetical protein